MEHTYLNNRMYSQEKQLLRSKDIDLYSDWISLDKLEVNNYWNKVKDIRKVESFIKDLSHLRYREKGLEGNKLRIHYRNILFASFNRTLRKIKKQRLVK